MGKIQTITTKVCPTSLMPIHYIALSETYHGLGALDVQSVCMWLGYQDNRH